MRIAPFPDEDGSILTRVSHIGAVVSRRQAYQRHLDHHFVGRDAERQRLRRTLDPDGPIAVFVHGMAGVGKSALLERFALDARAEGANVILVDCRAVAPSPPALLEALVGAPTSAVDTFVASLPVDRPTVVVLDHYEAFRIVDTWVRLDFVTHLPDSVGLVMGVRGRPPTGWHPDHGRHPTAPVQAVELGVLSRDLSARLLTAAGVASDAVDHLHHLTHGLPLALQIAAAAPDRQPETAQAALSEVASLLSEAYLSASAPPLRAAVDALSVTRRASATLLYTLVPDLTSAVVGELGRLPFVDTVPDGMRLHDAVRGPLAAQLGLTDPERLRRLQAAVWEQLYDELPGLDDDDRWRWMADLLFLVDHPLVREAFFPSGDPQASITSASVDDVPAILDIAERHLPAARRRLLERLLADHLRYCYVARDDASEVLAFSVVLDRAALASSVGRGDPILQEVQRQLRADAMPVDHDALMVYADLARDTGDQPSEPLAGLYLDLKRTYLALHDRLARVYTVREDPAPFLSHTAPLGFCEMGQVNVGGVPHTLVGLTFGAGSVDGWLTRLAARQFGSGDGGIVLDEQIRAVRVADLEALLSPLEFGVLAHIAGRGGRPSSRTELLRSVWGTDYAGGSNVVDAVVRTLRSKLGPYASAIETVRGVGYRLDRTALP